MSETGNLDARLSERFGGTFITENDANLLAMGERFARGDETSASSFLFLTFDNGAVGSAVVANGELIRGAQGYAGEISHLQVDPQGGLCACGGRGCLWMTLRNLTLDAESNAYIPMEILADQAASGHATAIRALVDIGRALGAPLGWICTMIDPSAIVVHSRLGESIQHVISGIDQTLSTSAPPAIAESVSIEPSVIGQDGEIRGAIELWREPFRRALR